jgi:membrane protein implicated in regulation of membrane protease activity
MRTIGRIFEKAQVGFWVLVIAVVLFYVVGLVMSVFSPLEWWLFTAVVVGLFVLFLLHERRIVHRLRDEDAPGHDELRRTLNSKRETRGF